MVPTRGPEDRRRGVTLVELLVVLTIVGLISGVSGLALAGLRSPRATLWAGSLREARARAIERGVAIRVTVDTASQATERGHAPLTVLFLPDGRVVGAGVDPFTGALVRATR